MGASGEEGEARAEGRRSKRAGRGEREAELRQVAGELANEGDLMIGSAKVRGREEGVRGRGGK